MGHQAQDDYQETQKTVKQSPRFLIALVLVAAEFALFTVAGTLAAGAQGADPGDRAKADETSCVATLRTINVAQASYQGGDETKGFARTLKELGPRRVAFIDAVMASGKKDGYRFQLTPGSDEANRSITHYTVTARPIRRLLKDQRSFFTDETHVIRFTTENRFATAADPLIDSASPK